MPRAYTLHMHATRDNIAVITCNYKDKPPTGIRTIFFSLRVKLCSLRTKVNAGSTIPALYSIELSMPAEAEEITNNILHVESICDVDVTEK